MSNIQSMNQRICIQLHQTVTDEIGNHTSSWADYYSCFAYVNLTSGSENGTQPAVRSDEILTFIFRWCRKLKSLNSKEYRIVFEGQIYNITCVDNVQFMHKKMKVLAKRERK